MYWNQARDLRRLRTHDWVYDQYEDAITDDERISGDPKVLMVLSPKGFDPANGNATFPATPCSLLVAQDVLVLGYKAGLGRKARLQKWSRYDVLRYGTGLWRGAGPGYEVRVEHRDAGRAAFVFSYPDEADALADYFKG